MHVRRYQVNPLNIETQITESITCVTPHHMEVEWLELEYPPASRCFRIKKSSLNTQIKPLSIALLFSDLVPVLVFF